MAMVFGILVGSSGSGVLTGTGIGVDVTVGVMVTPGKVATAVGDGAIAAFSAKTYIEEESSTD